MAPSLPLLHDDSSLARLLQRAERPVVVASHFSGWVEPWLALEPDDWRALREAFGQDIELARIETGSNREFALRHGLEILPEVLIFAAGRCVTRLHGVVGATRVIEALRVHRRRQAVLDDARREGLALEERSERAPSLRSVLRQRSSMREDPHPEVASGSALACAG